MKIVFIDSGITGHHLAYIKTLSYLVDEAVVIVPKKIDNFEIKQYQCTFPEGPKRKMIDFLKWNYAVKKIVDKEKPDIVHFLMGDDYYRFFGMGLGFFSKYKTILTLHWLRNGKLGTISTKNIAKKVNQIVMHSDYLKLRLNSYGIMNVVHIEYPQFGTGFYEKKEVKKYFNLKKDVPTIVCIGNTRYDKGVDILLEALEKIHKPFQLLIAGKATYFNEQFIEEKIEKYKNQVQLYLKYLSDDELAWAVSASDIVALPYRKKFDGASGPLGDGVVHSKMIVGPNHGNLGDTIKKNHLGFTFMSENIDSLAEVLDIALDMEWKPDEKYKEYQEMLSPEKFKEKYLEIYDIILD